MFTLEISQKVFYGSQFQAYTHILNVKEKQKFPPFYIHNSGPSFKSTKGSGKLVKRLDIYHFKTNSGNMKYIL